MVKTCGPSPRERHGTRHSSITSISRGSSLGADVAVPCHAVEAVTTYQAGIFRRHPLSSLEAAYVSSDFSDESGKFVADDRGDLSKDSYVAFKDMEVGAANPHSLDLSF